MPAGAKSTALYGSEAVSATALGQVQRATLKHDDNVPVSSFIDDVKRKLALRKIIGTNKGPALKQAEAYRSDERPPDGIQWTKEDVNYRYQSSPDRTCGACEHFIAPRTCDIVAGLIRAVDVCDQFEALDRPGVHSGPIPSRLVTPTNSFDEAAEGTVLSDRPPVRAVLVPIRRPDVDYVREWLAAQDDPDFKACIARGTGEVSPPGWAGTVKAMKKHADISNPWALAWYMKGKGAEPRYAPETEQDEAGTSQGAKQGWQSRKRAERIDKMTKDFGSKFANVGQQRAERGEPDPTRIDRSRMAAETEGGPGSGPRAGSKDGGTTHKQQQIRRATMRRDRADQAPSLSMISRATIARRFGVTAEDEGGPGSGPSGGKSVFAPDSTDSADDRQIDKFTRRETPVQRQIRITKQKVDPAQAKAVRRAFLVVRASLVNEGTMSSMSDGLPNPQPDHQQYTWPGLSHGRRGGEAKAS